MSRLIVKNLPIYLTEEKLKDHFSKKGIVTDVKILRNHEGKSRRFGFVGFKSDEEAEKAVKFFDQSFIDTAKLQVELARKLNDPKLMTQQEKRERQKRRRDELEHEGNKKVKVGNKQDEKETKLKEYMEVMGDRHKAKSWANDDQTGVKVVEDENEIPAAPLVDEKQSDDEYDQEEEKQEEEEHEHEGEDEDAEMMMPLSSKDEDGLANDSNVSDMDWLKKRRTRIVDGDVVNKEEKEDKRKENNKEEKKEEEVEVVAAASEYDQQVGQITESKRLFLRNLAYATNEQDLRELFSPYGQVEEAHIPMDSKKNKSKGIAHVMFNSGENAVTAWEELDGTTFQGRLLHILPGKPKRENKLDEFDLKNLPLKKQNELKKRANAMKDEFSWNSLYINSDTVMNVTAARLGVSKADLMNPTNTDAAVKQALAEASVLNNVRDYFVEKGVDLDSFKNKERSEAVILVKNFPYDTKPEELQDLFSICGDIQKILMPPDGGIAIVVFRTVPQGRAAFRRFAYKQFRSSILKLEKGPKDLFEDKSIVPEEGEGEAEVKEVKEAKANVTDVMEEESKSTEGTEGTAADRTSVFVKNLNFKTSSEGLSNVFRALQGFIMARVQTKAHKKDSSIRLSEGYGFVEFKTKHDAEIAVSTMDGYLLDDHKLQCKLSNRGREDEETSGSKLIKSKGRTKIHIKNLPFETSKRDIRDLFGRFGQLHTVRVPKKMDRTSRGFAFAEFKTSAEAENAMKALKDVHLLGRHLVLQWAEADAENPEEEIERMEAKVKKQQESEKYTGLRLSGKRSIDLEGNEDDNM